MNKMENQRRMYL